MSSVNPPPRLDTPRKFLKKLGLKCLKCRQNGLKMWVGEETRWARRSYTMLHWTHTVCWKFIPSSNARETKVKANLTANVKLKWLKMPKPARKGKWQDNFANRDDKERIPEIKPLFKGVVRPSTQLTVVCDTVLQNLGKYLRACGIDAAILESQQDDSSVINICQKEMRVILTRGKPFFMLHG